MVRSAYKVIDVHVHMTPLEMFKDDVRSIIASDRYYDPNMYEHLTRSPAKLVELLDEWGVERVNIVSYVAEDVMGLGYEHVDFVGRYCAEYPDVLRPMMSADPRDPAAVEKLEHYRSLYGSDWIKLHPVHQLFRPNAYRPEEGGLSILENIYEYAEANDIPVTFHTGTSIFPRSRNKYGDPMFLDDVAVDFPRLRIVMAHGGRPLSSWMNTTYYLMRRHKNIYLDISSIPPGKLLAYFPRLLDVVDRVLFGTDWYSLGVKNIRDNADQIIGLKLGDDITRKILHDNALTLFKGT
ncbi:MAG: amidohydrolase family protein [Conexivisphaera sp.]